MKCCPSLKAAIAVATVAIGLLSSSSTADAGFIGQFVRSVTGCGDYGYCSYYGPACYSYNPYAYYDCAYGYYGYGHGYGCGYGCGHDCGYGGYHNCGLRGGRRGDCGRAVRGCRERTRRTGSRRSGGRRGRRSATCSVDYCSDCDGLSYGNPCHEDGAVGCGRRGRRGRRANGGRRGRRGNEVCLSVDSVNSCTGCTSDVVAPSCAAPCHVEGGEPCYMDCGFGRTRGRRGRRAEGGRRSRRGAECWTVDCCTSVDTLSCAAPCHDVCVDGGRRGRRGGRRDSLLSRRERRDGWEVVAGPYECNVGANCVNESNHVGSDIGVPTEIHGEVQGEIIHESAPLDPTPAQPGPPSETL
ncbi:MAG: hypothetical protein R3B90_15705 [Planctomycetaceae bacterium]